MPEYFIPAADIVAPRYPASRIGRYAHLWAPSRAVVVAWFVLLLFLILAVWCLLRLKATGDSDAGSKERSRACSVCGRCNASTSTGIDVGTSTSTSTGIDVGTSTSTSTGIDVGTSTSTSTGIDVGTSTDTSTGIDVGTSTSTSSEIGSTSTCAGSSARSAGGPSSKARSKASRASRPNIFAIINSTGYAGGPSSKARGKASSYSGWSSKTGISIPPCVPFLPPQLPTPPSQLPSPPSQLPPLSPQLPPLPLQLPSHLPQPHQSSSFPSAPTAPNATPNEVGIDAGALATSSGQYGAQASATIPRRRLSLQHPPRTIGRAGVNTGERAAAAGSVSRDAQWNPLLLGLEEWVTFFGRLGCELMGSCAGMAEDGDILECKRVTCSWSCSDRYLFKKCDSLRFEAQQLVKLGEDANSTALERALAKYTEENDRDESLCASCGHMVFYSSVQFHELPPILAIEINRFKGHLGYKSVRSHISFPATLQMGPHMIVSQNPVYDLRAVVIHDGEHKGVGEYALCVRDFDDRWFFHRAGLKAIRITEETVLGVEACMLFYKLRTSEWNIPDSSEPWDVSDI